jgi:hypothetical protein
MEPKTHLLKTFGKLRLIRKSKLILHRQKFKSTFFRKLKIRIIYKAFPKIFLLKSREELVIGMDSENYEVVDKLERIANSLESLAESQKRVADTLEWIAKEKGILG